MGANKIDMSRYELMTQKEIDEYLSDKASRFKKVNVKDMSLQEYIKYYNETLYPLHYPYYLKTGVSCDKNGMISIIVQIGIPKLDIVDCSDFDIDNPTQYDFQDLLTIYGNNDKEIIKVIESVDWNLNHKEYFKKLWTNND